MCISGVHNVALRDTATPEDVIKAYFEAEIEKISHIIEMEKLMQWEHFRIKLAERGWDINRHQLPVDEWRWSTEELDKIK